MIFLDEQNIETTINCQYDYFCDVIRPRVGDLILIAENKSIDDSIFIAKRNLIDKWENDIREEIQMRSRSKKQIEKDLKIKNENEARNIAIRKKFGGDEKFNKICREVNEVLKIPARCLETPIFEGHKPGKRDNMTDEECEKYLHKSNFGNYNS